MTPAEKIEQFRTALQMLVNEDAASIEQVTDIEGGATAFVVTHLLGNGYDVTIKVRQPSF